MPLLGDVVIPCRRASTYECRRIPFCRRGCASATHEGLDASIETLTLASNPLDEWSDDDFALFFGELSNYMIRGPRDCLSLFKSMILGSSLLG